MNITQRLKSIELILSDKNLSDEINKINAYATVLVLCEEMEKHLDETYIHHNYIRENLLRIGDSAAYKCGIENGNHTVNVEAIISRLNSTIGLLNDSSRWPSTCFIVDESGGIQEGTNDPMH